MRKDRRERYDDGFRREALRLIETGAGKDVLARRVFRQIKVDVFGGCLDTVGVQVGRFGRLMVSFCLLVIS